MKWHFSFSRYFAKKLISQTPGEIYEASNWVTLRATRVLPLEKRPKTYLLELVSGSKGKSPTLVSDHGHAWIRLISPLGELYSVGFYPDESTQISPEYIPGLTFPGMLLNPDKYDSVGWNECVTSIPLTSQEFQKVRSHIENMQANRDQGALAFRLVDRNCLWFIVEVAALVEVKVDIEYSLSRHFFPSVAKKTKKFVTMTNLSVPKWLYQSIKCFKSLINTFLNIVYYALGGRVVVTAQWIRKEDGQVNKLSDFPFQPLFMGPGDIFRKTILFNHVIALQDWQHIHKNRGKNL